MALSGRGRGVRHFSFDDRTHVNPDREKKHYKIILRTIESTRIERKKNSERLSLLNVRVIINGFVRVSDENATGEKCGARVIIDGKDMVVLCVNSSRIVDPKSLAMNGTRHSLC